MLFSLEDERIESRIIDSSLLGMHARGLPLSLGVRPQVLKLRYVLPESSGTFLEPDLPFRSLAAHHVIPPGPELESEAFRRAPIEPEEAGARFFIGEMVSRIYTPVFERRDTLFDAILQRPVCSVEEAFSSNRLAHHAQSANHGCALAASGDQSQETLSFLPTLCPDCGWDLEGEQESLSLFCRNCSSAWQPRCGKLEKLDFGFVSPSGRVSILLPFWRIRTDIPGLSLGSYADLVRFANLRECTPKTSESQLHLWAPAFKTHPNLFIRLARSLTIVQREPAVGCELPRASLFPVTLPLCEALESMKVLLASLAVPKRRIFPRIAALSIILKDYTLTWLPFTESGEEFIQPEIRISIQKNALRWARLL